MVFSDFAMSIGTVVGALALVASMAMLTYIKRLQKNLEQEKSCLRIKLVASAVYYLLIFSIVIYSVRLTSLIIGFKNAHFQTSALVQFHLLAAFGLVAFCAWLFLQQRTYLTYFKSQKLSSIHAAYYLEQHSNFLRNGDVKKAYDSLFTACQKAPYGVELWCRLAFLCETLNSKGEADQYIQKAKSLLEAEKEPSNKEIACYENYFGAILWCRGQDSKAIEHVERSIKLDANDGRKATYQKMLDGTFMRE